jgi:hypothetical protein
LNRATYAPAFTAGAAVRVVGASATKFGSAAELKTFLHPQAKGGPPESVAWHMHLDYIGSVMRAPLPLRERLPIFRYIARSACRYRKDLWRESWAKLLPHG